VRPTAGLDTVEEKFSCPPANRTMIPLLSTPYPSYYSVCATSAPHYVIMHVYNAQTPHQIRLLLGSPGLQHTQKRRDVHTESSRKPWMEDLHVEFFFYPAFTTLYEFEPPHFRGSEITHKNAPQSVGLLWTSDQPIAENST
jgi:hypothetical protein